MSTASRESLAFNLRLGVLSEVLWVVPPPREAYEQAAAIAYLRIESTAPPEDCANTGIVYALHDARVLAVLKGQLPASIHMTQEMAGGCFEGSRLIEGLETTYRIGDEYMIFLRGGAMAFGRLAGASLAFPVRGGLVETGRFMGMPPKMMIDEFKRVVEQLSR